ncbi:hypothetical protein EGK_20975, partial [Macaca mulatta]
SLGGAELNGVVNEEAKAGAMGKRRGRAPANKRGPREGGGAFPVLQLSGNWHCGRRQGC